MALVSARLQARANSVRPRFAPERPPATKGKYVELALGEIVALSSRRGLRNALVVELLRRRPDQAEPALRDQLEETQAVTVVLTIETTRRIDWIPPLHRLLVTALEALDKLDLLRGCQRGLSR